MPDAYIDAAKTLGLRAGNMMSVSVSGKDILVANVDGVLYAMQRKCPHMGADLCKGTLAGAMLTCPRHGAVFDVTTGVALEKAGVLFLKVSVKNATTFPVTIEGDRLRVTIS